MLARGARMSDTSYLVLCAYTLMHTRITMCVISPRHARLALGHCWHWLALGTGTHGAPYFLCESKNLNLNL